MRNRRYEEDYENHERWLVSYADFITLMFAFFVVMYSVSSVHEGKYRVLSSTMEDVFSETTPRDSEPVEVNEILKTVDPENLPKDGEGLLPDYHPPSNSQGESDIPKGYKDGEQIVEELKGAATKFEEAGFEVKLDEKWVEIKMNSQVLFGSGNAKLSQRATPILNELTGVLSDFKNPMRVEGFTDDRPINTPIYPSNWELSAARAASVVNHFTKQDLDPQRMAAVGYGEYRPIGDNSTAAGRNENRRIVIMISTDATQLQADADKNIAQQQAEERRADDFSHTIRQPGPEGFEE